MYVCMCVYCVGEYFVSVLVIISNSTIIDSDFGKLLPLFPRCSILPNGISFLFDIGLFSISLFVYWLESMFYLFYLFSVLYNCLVCARMFVI